MRQMPGLAALLALAGTAVWMFMTVKALLALTGADQTGVQVEAVADRTGAIELSAQFFSQYWLLLLKCMVPALGVALLCCRRWALVLPATLLCGWLFL